MSYTPYRGQDLFDFLVLYYPISLGGEVLGVTLQLDLTSNKKKSESFLKVLKAGEKKGRKITEVKEIDPATADELFKELKKKMNLPVFVDRVRLKADSQSFVTCEATFIPLVQEN